LEEQFSDISTQQIVALWNKIHENTNDNKLVAKYLQNLEIYNQIARQNNQIIIISNFKKHQFLTISDNFNNIYEYDCSLEDCLKWGFFYFTRSITWEQIKVMFQISNWYSKIKGKQNNLEPYYKQSYCGWQFKIRKTGQVKYLFSQQQGLEFSAKGEPIIVMTTVTDITHLLRPNPPFWSTISFDKNNLMPFLYHSDKKEITQTDLLSPRETEFIKAFESGLELKAISENMGISYKTADSHRINILNRLGARNTMAAIDLVKRL
jgi:DNA-binding CsgD family transcriptional regulator